MLLAAMFKVNLFGTQNTEEAKQEAAKELAKTFAQKLKQEARQIERGIRKIEREEEKMKKKIKDDAKAGRDTQAIAIQAKSLVRSQKATNRLWTVRTNLMAAENEVKTIAASMRLSDSMKKSTEVLQQMNTLVNIPELQESMRDMSREMMKAGMIDEIMEEGMDVEDLEEETAAEVGKIFDEIGIDAALKMAIVAPMAAAEVKVAQPAAPVAPVVVAPDPVEDDIAKRIAQLQAA